MTKQITPIWVSTPYGMGWQLGIVYEPAAGTESVKGALLEIRGVRHVLPSCNVRKTKIKSKTKTKAPPTWTEYQYCQTCGKDTLHGGHEDGQYERYRCILCGNSFSVRVR